MSHRTSKCERKSGLRSLPAPAYAASWPLVAKIARPKIARPVSTAGENPPGVLFAGRRNRALVFGSSVSTLRFGVALEGKDLEGHLTPDQAGALRLVPQVGTATRQWDF